jgi:hypothetical protein
MIKNQLGRRNLVPYVRAELALKLKGFFEKKAKDNLSNNFESFGKLVEKKTIFCQNSDKLESTDNQESKKITN